MQAIATLDRTCIFGWQVDQRHHVSMSADRAPIAASTDIRELVVMVDTYINVYM